MKSKKPPHRHGFAADLSSDAQRKRRAQRTALSTLTAQGGDAGDFGGDWPDDCPPLPSWVLGPKDAWVNAWTAAMVYRDAQDRAGRKS